MSNLKTSTNHAPLKEDQSKDGRKPVKTLIAGFEKYFFHNKKEEEEIPDSENSSPDKNTKENSQKKPSESPDLPDYKEKPKTSNRSSSIEKLTVKLITTTNHAPLREDGRMSVKNSISGFEQIDHRNKEDQSDEEEIPVFVVDSENSSPDKNTMVNSPKKPSESPDVPDYIVISGDGKNKGHCLGEYHLIDPDKIIYQQSSSEQQDEYYRAKYIWRVEGSGWMIGRKVGEKVGWFFNPSLSTTLPRSGWKWADGKGGWFADDSITVNEGRLISGCTKIIITLIGAALKKWPKGAGVFKIQHRRKLNGRHIYKNKENYLLFCSNDGSWSIGDKLGYYGIKSKSTPNVPSSADEWFYWTGSEVKGAKVEVTC